MIYCLFTINKFPFYFYLKQSILYPLNKVLINCLIWLSKILKSWIFLLIDFYLYSVVYYNSDQILIMDEDYEMFKIVVIGSQGTGKTNISTRYIRN